MSRTRVLCLAGLLILAGAPAALADEPTPEELLNQHGLTKDGRRFIVATDAEALDYYQRKVRPRVNTMATAYNLWASKLQINYDLEQALQEWPGVKSQLDDANATLLRMPERDALQKINKQPYYDFRNEVLAYANRLDANIGMLKRNFVGPVRMDKLKKDFEEKRDDFLKALEGFWPIVNKTKEELDTLKGDAAVTNARNAFVRQTKANLPIDYSEKLEKTIQFARATERKYSPDTAPPVNTKGGKKRPVMKANKAAQRSKASTSATPAEPAQ